MDLVKLKTYSVKKRRSKVKRAMFACPVTPGASFTEFLACWPEVLKACDFKSVVTSIVKARQRKKPVMFLLGAHVVKCGLSPLIIQLVERGVVTLVATNGAGIIHDFEMAYCGQTSEDVAQSLSKGLFGMGRETADGINAAIHEGVSQGNGLGVAVGRYIAQKRFANKEISLAYSCVRQGVPLTVHVAIGTDIIHQHASFNGAETGEATARDFRRFTQEVALLNDGGVVVSFGSAVILPEVFLKALSVARNLTGRVRHFTTAYFDMSQQYRPQQNIVSRPVLDGGQGFYFTGHHEIMLPLLAQAVLEQESSWRKRL
jgi:hypothetical protein